VGNIGIYAAIVALLNILYSICFICQKGEAAAR
jgi:hypothetical protein